MAKTSKRATGDLGEDIACKYLQNKGFSVIERNYLRKWGEIDLIAEKACLPVGRGTGKAKRLYFIEVKTVTRESFWSEGSRVTGSIERGFRPEDNVHPRKLQRLHRAIQTYLLDHKVPEAQEWQLDIACVYLHMDTRRARVEVLENVIL